MRLHPDLSEDSELPCYPDQWEAYFEDALKRHGLEADDETLEYMVKRFEIPTMIARRVVNAFRDEEPRPSVRQAFDGQVERYRQKGYALSADDAEVLFQGLGPTIPRRRPARRHSAPHPGGGLDAHPATGRRRPAHERAPPGGSIGPLDRARRPRVQRAAATSLITAPLAGLTRATPRSPRSPR